MSTCEAEYIALSKCCREAIWTRATLTLLGAPQESPMKIHEDNEAAAAIASSNAETTNKRTNTADVRNQYTQIVARGEITVVPRGMDDMVANILVKSLRPEKQKYNWTIRRGCHNNAYLE